MKVQRAPGGPGMTERLPSVDPVDVDDATLMERVGKMRDRDAFGVLFERHQQASYNIAWHLTRNATLAEEALQNAMLRVWTAAPGYQHIGAVRNWILKITVREALHLNREQQSIKDRAMRKQELDAKPEPQAPPETHEQHELLEALRSRLQQLDHQSREILAMYFGAGMTQEEIADALTMQQTTVSRRIQQILKDLKTQLSQAGCAAALPLLTEGGRNFCEGLVAPPGMQAKVLARLGQSSMRMSRSMTPPRLILGYVAAGVAVPVLLLAGMVVYSSVKAPAANVPSAAVTPSVLSITTYRDHFESSNLDELWEASDAQELRWEPTAQHAADGTPVWHPRGQVRTAQGQMQSRLELWAWGQTWAAKPSALDSRTPESAGPPSVVPGPASSCELCSQPLALKTDAPFYIDLDAYPPEGAGNFTYGIELLDASNRCVYRQGYSAESQADGKVLMRALLEKNGQPQLTNVSPESKDETEPFSVNGRITSGEKAAEKLISTRNHETIDASIGGHEVVRIKFFVTVEPGGWVRWPIERLELSHAPIREPEFRHAWNFADGPSTELSQNPNLWVWERATPGEPGCMRTNSVKPTSYDVLWLPFDAPRAPFKVTVQARMRLGNPTVISSFDGFWIECDATPWHRFWLNECSLKPEQWTTLTVYFKGRYSFCYIGQRLFAVREARHAYPSRRVFLSLRGMDIQRIQTEPVSEDAWPVELKDPAQLTQKMKNGPKIAPRTEFLSPQPVQEP